MATTTHNVDIRARSTGFRVIKRKIDNIGVAANNATRGIFLMQRAIFVLGGAGAIRAITRQLDLLTNYENRLRLTSKSASNLEEIQTRLFQVARDSRTSFEAVADIYSRTALSVRELGISQEETLTFTESLSKATIISGASAREAHAALIQLGQGMASNTLRGDELRSVLEQLPFVADVIAKSLGVTRGELREMGADGKISAETILKAFREAEDEINTLFGNTVPTIAQALSIANSNWLQFLDNLDDTTNGSAKLAKAIIVLSENLNLIIGTLATLGVALAATFAGRALTSIANYVVGLKTAALRSVRLLEVENLRATASVRNNAAQVAQNAQRQVELTQRLSLLGIQKAQLQQTVLDTQFTVVNGQARNIATGRFVALGVAKANLSRATQQLSIVENVELTTAGRLTSARAAQTAATTSAAAANARLAGAQAAQATTAARLTSMLPMLAGGIGLVSVAMSSLAAFIGPIGLTVLAVAAVIAIFVKWGNIIKVTSDGMVGLRDFVVAAFQLMTEEILPFTDSFKEGFNSSISFVSNLFVGFGSGVIKTIEFIGTVFYDTLTVLPRAAQSAIAGVIAAFKTLPPGAGAAATAIANALIAGFEAFANGAIKAINLVIGAINKLVSFVGGTKAAELFGFSGQIGELGSVELGRFKSEYAGAGDAAAEAFSGAFKETFESTSLESLGNAFGNLLDPITDRARSNVQDAISDDKLIALAEANKNTTDSGSGGGKGGGKGKGKDFGAIIAGMNKEIELLRLTNSERERAEEILKIEKDLKRGLTQTELELANATLKSLDAARTQAEVLESITGPREEIKEQQMALNALFEQGRLSVEDYTVAIREMQTAADSAAGTLAGGFRASITSAIMSASELGSALGDVVVGAADSAADAIVEFAKTGKFNIKSFFFDLFSQITKLIAKQLILKALGFVFGAPLGGATGGGGALGFSSGGSILPSGPGSTDSQLVQFAKRPDERVDILTPGQQNAQKNNKGVSGNEAPTVNVAAPNIAVVVSPADIAGALGGSEGDTMIVKAVERNAKSIKQVLGA